MTPSSFSRRSLLLLLGCLVLATPPVSAKTKRLDEFQSPSEVKPGQSGLLKSAKGMSYFLRVPRKYSATAGSRLVIFLHGSSSSGHDYMQGFDDKKWAEDSILCLPNGEKGGDPYGSNNFTFESANFVSEITKDVQKAFKATVTYIGGHSQGAFVTYSTIMHFPELYHGAFSIAGDCWIQNEPNLWLERPEVMAKQRKIAIAVIHGKADPVVAFSQGEHAHDCFLALGWPKLRFFAPEKLDHRFIFAPVEEALEWLDAMSGQEEKKSFTAAAKWGRAGEWGWVRQVAINSKSPPASMLKATEDAATKALPAIESAVQGKPAEWIPKLAEFRRLYGETDAARNFLASQEQKRKAQQPKAGSLWGQWQQANQAGNKSEAAKLLEQIRDTASLTYEGYFAWRWSLHR